MAKVWILTIMCTAGPPWTSACPTNPAWTDLPFREEQKCLDLGAFIAKTQSAQGLKVTYSCDPN
jgi:hypothetical protein